MTIVCVSNFIPEIRSCVLPGEHETVCDGWEYRYDPEQGWEVATGGECPGCAPRRADVGFVCSRCYVKVQTALAAYAAWRPLAAAFGPTDRAVAPDGSGGGRALGYVPISSVHLDWDAIFRAHMSYPDRGGIDMWVAREDGAQDALRFAAAMRGVPERHEVREPSRKLHRTYCPECEQLTLVWHPPAHEGAEVVVKCRNPKCGHTVNPAAHDDIAYIENSVYRKRARR